MIISLSVGSIINGELLMLLCKLGRLTLSVKGSWDNRWGNDCWEDDCWGNANDGLKAICCLLRLLQLLLQHYKNDPFLSHGCSFLGYSFLRLSRLLLHLFLLYLFLSLFL